MITHNLYQTFFSFLLFFPLIFPLQYRMKKLLPLLDSTIQYLPFFSHVTTSPTHNLPSFVVTKFISRHSSPISFIFLHIYYGIPALFSRLQSHDLEEIFFTDIVTQFLKLNPMVLPSRSVYGSLDVMDLEDLRRVISGAHFDHLPGIPFFI